MADTANSPELREPDSCDPTAVPRRHDGIRRQHGWLTRIGRKTRWLHRPIATTGATALTAALTRVPTVAVGPLASALGHGMFYAVPSKARRKAIHNLGIAFPDLAGEDEKKKLFKRAYLAQARCMMDSFAAVRRPDWIESQVDGWQEVRARIEDVLSQGKGMVLLTGHLGAWEIMSLTLTRYFPMTFVAKRSKNPTLNPVIEKVRTCRGGKVHYHDEPPRALLAILRQGGIAGFVGDRAFRGTSVTEIPFFGRETRMPSAPFALARTSGAPLAFIFFLRHESGYRVVLSETFSIGREEPRETTIREAAQRWVGFLEQQIRANPENWVPFAGHWKSQREKTKQDAAEADS